ncbi:Putative ribonuclease H protein At1g65750 [Linum perenne]
MWRPKSQGGLSLRSAKELNEAYLLKLGWQILKSPEKLWVRTLTNKYLKEVDDELTIRRKNWGSALWREVATIELDETEESRTVAEAVDEYGEWDWRFLHNSLPPHIVLHVAGMKQPSPDSGEDDLIWGPDPKGLFSIKSTYEVLSSIGKGNDGQLWKIVWNWKGPNRIRFFLWLAAHNRLLTNGERKRRHLTSDDLCNHCKAAPEDTLHTLRDCQLAEALWSCVIPPNRTNEFFSEMKRDTLISWLPPPDDWLKINTDGLVTQPHSQAAGGGVIRNSQGRDLIAFSANLGACSIMRAELRAAEIGLDQAWKLGAKKVLLELDSLAAVRAIEEGSSWDTRHGPILLQIQQFKSRDWQVEIRHCYWEASRVADQLAHLGHCKPLGVHLLTSLPPRVRSALFSDCTGVSLSRLIPINI